MSDLILINVTGKDRTGLVSRMTAVLAEQGVNVLDIGQAVIHDYISLGLLVEIPDAERAAPLLKDLLFAGHELGVHVDFRPVAPDYYESWVAEQAKERYIVTLLGRKLTAQQVSRVAGVCAQHDLNIDVITRTHWPRLPAPPRPLAQGRRADDGQRLSGRSAAHAGAASANFRGNGGRYLISC